MYPHAVRKWYECGMQQKCFYLNMSVCMSEYWYIQLNLIYLNHVETWTVYRTIFWQIFIYLNRVKPMNSFSLEGVQRSEHMFAVKLYCFPQIWLI